MGKNTALKTKAELEAYVDSAFGTLVETHRSLLDIENKIDDMLSSKKTDVPSALMSLGTDVSDLIDTLEEQLNIEGT